MYILYGRYGMFNVNLNASLLRPRLLAAKEMLGTAHTIADIGCDHGKLALELIRSGSAQRVIASDISEASLRKAQTLARNCGMEAMIEFRISDGFLNMPDDIECSCIAGMGGELIARILENGMACVRNQKRIVMQPMRGESELRKYLYENGFRILTERIALDGGRYYQVLCAHKGRPEPPPSGWPKDYFQFGWSGAFLEDSNFPKLLSRYIGILKRKLSAAEARGVLPTYLEFEIESSLKILSMIG